MIFTPPEDMQEDQRRMKVAEALLAQSQQGGGGGYGPALAQIAQAFAGKKMKQDAQENMQNRRMGVNPTAPAFDDQGYSMPRAPGMAQPSMLQSIQNFFTRGTS